MAGESERVARNRQIGRGAAVCRRRGAGVAARRLRLRVSDRLELYGAGRVGPTAGGALGAEPRLVRVMALGRSLTRALTRPMGTSAWTSARMRRSLKKIGTRLGCGATRGRECAPIGRVDRRGREGFGSDGAPVVERVGREPCAAAGDAARGGELTVRLTIERLRTLVLAAGVLLLAALVVFLAVGRWKNPFNRRDLPQRLGIEIQSDSGGVTYTQARGGTNKWRCMPRKPWS